MKRKTITFMIVVVVVIAILTTSIYFIYTSTSTTGSIFNRLTVDSLSYKYDNTIDDNKEYTVTINSNKNLDIQCSIDDVTYDKCELKLTAGDHKIYVKNNDNKIEYNINIETKYEGEFSTTLDRVEEYYLALNGDKTLEYTFNYPEGFDTKRKYSIDDESIISIEGDTIKGLKVGTTNLHVSLKDGNNKTYKITVTNLIQPATLNNNKQYLPCLRYSEEEAALLDKILESRVQEAGVGTRGAVVATARFLTLEFPYQIRYFNENGRLVTHGTRPYIDGEGRYYHKGLYLAESKYKDIIKSTASGPRVWGCNIYDQFISKMNMNGFTCSGFVTWSMYNAGFDIGDVGAGDYAQFDDDLSDMGPHHEITDEYMKQNTYKVGDFIARNGHAALIIGISDDTIYTAESLPPKLKVYIYGRYNPITKHGGNWKSLVDDDNLTYVIEMSSIYPNGDGWYTNMW